jgi:hypothetical protein
LQGDQGAHNSQHVFSGCGNEARDRRRTWCNRGDEPPRCRIRCRRSARHFKVGVQIYSLEAPVRLIVPCTPSSRGDFKLAAATGVVSERVNPVGQGGAPPKSRGKGRGKAQEKGSGRGHPSADAAVRTVSARASAAAIGGRGVLN